MYSIKITVFSLNTLSSDLGLNYYTKYIYEQDSNCQLLKAIIFFYYYRLYYIYYEFDYFR